MKGLTTSALAALAALGCSGEQEREGPHGITAEVSQRIATVVTVSWLTDAASIGYVEYGPTEEFGRVTPLAESTSKEHRRALLGLKADTLYYYRVVSLDGGSSDVQSIRTGNLPLGLPQLTLEGNGHDLFTIVPVLGAGKAVTIIDPDGDIVWYHKEDRDLDFYRARLSVDGETLIYNAGSVSGDVSDEAELVRVALDGSETSSIPVPLLAHDFVEHPDGTLAAIVVEYRDFEGEPLRGDTIVEIDPDSGAQTTVWSSWDCFDPAEWTGDDIAHGWTFANALDYDPAEGVYYIGMRNFSSIAKISPGGNGCEWVLGLYGATMEFSPESEQFLHQHQFDLNGDRLVVLDNDGDPRSEPVSRVLEYQIDTAANRAAEVWSYVSSPPVYTFVGEPTRLEDGDTFINWSAAGQLERVTPNGEAIWKLQSGAGFAFAFHTLAPSLYPPGASYPQEQ